MQNLDPIGGKQELIDFLFYTQNVNVRDRDFKDIYNK